MSELRVDNIVDMGGSGAPKLRKGANVTGISTITQAVVGNATINAGGINATGIVTSSSNKFVGDLASGNITAGVMTATSSVVASNITINSGGVNASGIVSATSYQGSGANLTGIGLSIAPLIYSPELGATEQALKPTIELSFNQRIKAGSGNVNLRMVSAGSTIIQSFGVGSSVTIDNSGTLPKVSFTPTNDLGLNSVIYVDIPAGAFKTPIGTDIAATSWTFTTDNIFYYWGAGENTRGQLAINDAVRRSSPVQIGSHKWLAISSSSYGAVAVQSNGTLWGWGNDQVGQLGQNSVLPSDNAGRSSPVQIPGTTWSKNITRAIYYNSFAVKTDGTLWAWGQNANGHLGLNDRTSRSSPVQVGSDTNWATGKEQSGGGYVNHCIKSDGTLWTWGGDGEYGTFGNSSLGKYSSPTQVPGTTWSTVFTSLYQAGALKTDGTLWAWGQNNKGGLGQNDTNKRSSPIQIPGTWSSATTLRWGNSYAGSKTDGTLWAWGENVNGELGQNSVVNYSSPVQIPGTTWSKVKNAGESFVATKTDGTLWSWGENAPPGTLGLNQGPGQLPATSSPTQIPGTTWQVVLDSHSGLLAGKS